MEGILEFAVAILLSTPIAFGLIRYFSQKAFESYLQQRIETHKSELAKLNISHQIQFSSLHKERAELIRKLYYSLYDCKKAIIAFFYSETDARVSEVHLQRMLDQWAEFLRLFSDTFNKNRIFFPTEQAELMDSLNREMLKISDLTNSFLSSFSSSQEQISAIREKAPRFQNFKKEGDSLIEKISILEEQLETEFRRLLGVEIQNKWDIILL